MRKLKAILLAAGGSRRLGHAKQLLLWQGKSLLQHAIEKLQVNKLDVHVVLGSSVEQIAANSAIANVIINEHWQNGMGSSIAAGAGSLSNEDDAVLICLVDQIAITQHDIKNIIKNWERRPDQISCACYAKDKPELFGPPVIFPQKYFSQLQQLNGGQGAKKIIHQERLNEAASVSWVDMLNALVDIDTPTDWQEWCSRPNVKIEEKI